jgi:hypothetical protein
MENQKAVNLFENTGFLNVTTIVSNKFDDLIQITRNLKNL